MSEDCVLAIHSTAPCITGLIHDPPFFFLFFFLSVKGQDLEKELEKRNKENNEISTHSEE